MVTIDGAWMGLDLGEGSFSLIHNSIFSNIDSTAIMIQALAQLEIAPGIGGENDFSACTNLCVHNATIDTVFARGNTWPSADSATIDTQYIYDDDEDPSLGPVIFVSE